MEEIAKIIVNYGLSAGLLIYMIVKIEKVLMELRDYIKELIVLTNEQNDKIDAICQKRRGK